MINITRGEERVFYGKTIKSWTDTIEDGAIEQIEDICTRLNIDKVYVLPDVHRGYLAPIGTAVTTNGVIIPELLGNDIGCGISCHYLGINLNDMDKSEQDRFLSGLYEFLTSGRFINSSGYTRGKTSDAYSDPIRSERYNMGLQMYDRIISEGITSVSIQMIDNALGTIGGGNHFIEIAADEKGNLFSVVHTGSRFLGSVVLEHVTRIIRDYGNCIDELVAYVSEARCDTASIRYLTEIDKKSMSMVFNILSDNYSLEKVYRSILLAQDFARMNRTFIGDTIYHYIHKDKYMDRINDLDPEVLGFPTMIDCEHNMISCPPNPDGSRGVYFVHRKGVAMLEDGYGIIAGNQIDGSYIVKETKENILGICSHGAGRVMSRSEARTTLNEDEEKLKLASSVPYNTFNGKGSLEECSSVYKNIEEVLSLQSDLVTPVAHLKPIINIKG